MEFAQILEKTLKWEGGLSDHPQDRGGLTKYGITLNTLRAIHKESGREGSIEENHIKNLTKKQATDIYKDEYFEKPNINLLHFAIQPVVFDMAVNHGPSRSGKMLQHVINLVGFAQIAEDGVIGKVTIRAADQCYDAMGHLFINAICDERQSFYNRIVARNRNQEVFIRGWTNRTNDFRIKID